MRSLATNASRARGIEIRLIGPREKDVDGRVHAFGSRVAADRDSNADHAFHIPVAGDQIAMMQWAVDPSIDDPSRHLVIGHVSVAVGLEQAPPTSVLDAACV